MVRALDEAGIDYMVAGSVASTLHGHPRTTQDIDIVIDPSSESLNDLLDGLDTERYYVSAARARSALVDHDQFNLIDNETGWKVDLIVRKDRDFSRTEFDRRARAEVVGVSVFVASAEDTVLSKLEWAALGDSERQVRDAAAVLSVSDVDDDYLDHWAAELGLGDLLDQARTMSGR